MKQHLIDTVHVEINSHVTVCRNPQFYTTFPAVVAIAEQLLLFSVKRRVCGWPGFAGAYSHHSCLSRLMSSRSMDGGRSWSKAELLYASPVGGCQDGGLYYDGRYLYANSFLWIHVPQILAQKLRDNGYGTYLENMSAATLPGGCFCCARQIKGILGKAIQISAGQHEVLGCRKDAQPKSSSRHGGSCSQGVIRPPCLSCGYHATVPLTM